MRTSCGEQAWRFSSSTSRSAAQLRTRQRPYFHAHLVVPGHTAQGAKADKMDEEARRGQ